MSSIKNRLLELIDKEGINPNQFYEKSGLSNGFIDKVGAVLQRKTKNKIALAFPEWDIDYIEFGIPSKSFDSTVRDRSNNAFNYLKEKERIINEALNLIINASREGISNYRIAKDTLISERTIGNYVNGDTKPSFANAKIIIEYFNRESNIKTRNPTEVTVITNPNILMVPLVGQYAYAGYLAGFTDPEYIETLPKIPVYVDHEAKGEYLNFEVKGDSMDDGSANSICDRDIITCRSINSDLWKSKLHINKWYFVIVHKTEGVLVKKIIDHNTEKGSIIIHSLNPDKTQYPDRVINLNEVAMLFNVIKITREMKI